MVSLAVVTALCVAALWFRPGTGDRDRAPADTDESGRTGQERVFPGPDDTGVPDAIELTPYTGPCTLTEPTVLARVDATEACLAIIVQAADVVIEESRVPRVDVTAAEHDASFSVRVSDSEVVAGDWLGGALWGMNIVAERVEITGGQHSVHCSSTCQIEDSWLHDQANPDGGSAHNNAFLSNGGVDMVVRGNTLHCTAVLNSTEGGCTGDLSLFGDFGPISDVWVEDNLFRANESSISYCAYGGHAPGKAFPVATFVVFVDNVFERGEKGQCGVSGADTSFHADAEGNRWQDNVWDDGTSLVP